MYEIYEVINGETFVYGTAPTRYKARKVAKEIGIGVRTRRIR